MAFITLIYHLHALMFVYVFYHFVLEQKQQKSCFQEGRLCPGPTLLLFSAYLLIAKHPCVVVIVVVVDVVVLVLVLVVVVVFLVVF